ncbi:MAG: hypothetical protein KGD63_15025 [Candidatus Lokiarchaeota archaeon]|nr:hypothetical protein [Candidatus Lokiarchaeota archaeon]
MSSNKSQNIPDYEKLSDILIEIKKEGKFSGVFLSYLDGRLLIKETQENYNLKDFIPMIASVLKSADGLGKTIGGRKLNKIIAQLEDISLMILRNNERNMFLTLIINEFSRVNSVLDNINIYFKKINQYC